MHVFRNTGNLSCFKVQLFYIYVNMSYDKKFILRHIMSCAKSDRTLWDRLQLIQINTPINLAGLLANQTFPICLFYARRVYTVIIALHLLYYSAQICKRGKLSSNFGEFLCAANCTLIRVDLMSLSAVCVIARERCRGWGTLDMDRLSWSTLKQGCLRNLWRKTWQFTRESTDNDTIRSTN